MENETEETSLRDDIESAFEASSTPAPEPVTVSQPTSAVSPREAEPTPARTRAEDGKFAKKPTTDPEEPNGAMKPKSSVGRDAAAPESPGSGPGAAAPVESVPVQALKAPQSWKPAAREKWASLPPEVQQEAIRRERESEHALRESAEARKGYQQFREVVGPYEAFIRAAGSDPLKTVENMCRTAVMLRTAPPAQKAQGIASLIREHNIDINLLAAALDGQPMPQSARGNQGELRDPRVDALFEKITQAEERRNQSLVTEASQSLSEFAETHEFLDDVRLDMADLMESAGKRGIVLTNEQAYSKACMLNDDIAKIIEQRKAAQSAATSQGATQRARNAASSVRSSPTVQSNGTQSKNLRGVIEEAFDEASSR
jgi:hypothetical protein